jgi:hypothetical protein
MTLFVDLLERGLARINYPAQVASRRRDLQAWGTVERKGSGWSWRWSGLGLALPELLPEPVPCVSDDAAWSAMDAIVTEYVRRIGAGG